MKEKILTYFKSDRSYTGGVALVLQFSSRLHIRKQLNIQSESDYMLGVIHEELRELAGISRPELTDMLKEPVVVKSEVSAPVEDTSAASTADPVDVTGQPAKVTKKAVKPSADKIPAPKKESRKK
jgi:hypothetical protein